MELTCPKCHRKFEPQPTDARISVDAKTVQGGAANEQHRTTVPVKCTHCGHGYTVSESAVG